MASEYLLALFKAFVTFVFVGIIGFAIENWYSASQAKRDRERVLLQASYGALSQFGASLSFLRAALSRLPPDQTATGDNLKDYRAAFRQFSETKVPFIVGMEQLGTKDRALIAAFDKLNKSAIKLDRCVLGVGGADCNFNEDFPRFVTLSTGFERGMIEALVKVE